MANAKKILGSIVRAAENARERCPDNEQDRATTFVCYLSGALEAQGPDCIAASKAVFDVLKWVPAPTEGK